MLKAYSTILDGRVHSDYLDPIKDFSKYIYYSRLRTIEMLLFLFTNKDFSGYYSSSIICDPSANFIANILPDLKSLDSRSRLRTQSESILKHLPRTGDLFDSTGGKNCILIHDNNLGAEARIITKENGHFNINNESGNLVINHICVHRDKLFLIPLDTYTIYIIIGFLLKLDHYAFLTKPLAESVVLTSLPGQSLIYSENKIHMSDGNSYLVRTPAALDPALSSISTSTEKVKPKMTVNKIATNLKLDAEEAIKTATKIEVGNTAIALFRSKALSIIPVEHHKYIDTPLFDLIIALLFNVSVQQFASTNKKAEYVSEALMVSGVYNSVKLLNIPKLISEMVDSISVPDIIDVK